MIATILYIALFAGQAGAKPPVKPAAKPVVTFDRLSKQADTAREQNHLDEAIGYYRQALKLRPAWREGWWYLGTLFYDQDRYSDALEPFRKLIAMDSNNGPALALLGLCEYETKDYGAALMHLNRARMNGLGDNKQMSQVVFYHNAILLTKYERYESALEILLEIVKRGMSGPKIIEAAGMAALRMPILPPELPEKDREVVALTGKAVCTAGERNAASAQQQFQELLAKYPDAPNVHYTYGAYLMMSDPDGAVAQMQKELEISHDHLPALVALSFEFMKRGEPEKGLDYAERAVKTAPTSFAAYAALGKVLVETGKTADGIEKLEYAAKLAPDSPQVRIALASAYAKVGRASDAAKERAEFLRLKGTDQASPK